MKFLGYLLESFEYLPFRFLKIKPIDYDRIRCEFYLLDKVFEVFPETPDLEAPGGGLAGFKHDAVEFAGALRG